MQRWWNDAAGWLLLRWAAVLHRTVSGRTARERNVARRDAAIRGARQRGVPVEQLAASLGLSEGWVRQVLAGKKLAEPPAVEEAA